MKLEQKGEARTMRDSEVAHGMCAFEERHRRTPIAEKSGLDRVKFSALRLQAGLVPEYCFQH